MPLAPPEQVPSWKTPRLPWKHHTALLPSPRNAPGSFRQEELLQHCENEPDETGEIHDHQTGNVAVAKDQIHLTRRLPELKNPEVDQGSV